MSQALRRPRDAPPTDNTSPNRLPPRKSLPQIPTIFFQIAGPESKFLHTMKTTSYQFMCCCRIVDKVSDASDSQFPPTPFPCAALPKPMLFPRSRIITQIGLYKQLHYNLSCINSHSRDHHPSRPPTPSLDHHLPPSTTTPLLRPPPSLDQQSPVQLNNIWARSSGHDTLDKIP